MSAMQPDQRQQGKTTSTNDRALQLLDDVELLARFLFQLNQKNANSITKRRRELEAGHITADEVIAHFGPIKQEILKNSKCAADIGKLREETAQIPPNWPGVFIPHWQLKHDFPGFHNYVPTHAPAHALFLVLVRGTYEVTGRPEVWVAEGSMYENMCMAVNELCATQPIVADSSVSDRKNEIWLIQSVIVNSFLFVEAFLNGIGIDCLVSRWGALSAKERKLLAEFDFDKQTESWVKFRDKLLKYPRIAVGARHPLLQENNDSDVRAFSGELRELRDSIVHASHRIYERGGGPGLRRVTQLLQLGRDREIAFRCADTALRLVRKVHASMGRDEEALSWLIDRDPETGLFPPRAFE